MEALAQPVHLHLSIPHQVARIDRSQAAVRIEDAFGLEASVAVHAFSQPPAGVAAARRGALLSGLLAALLALPVLALALAALLTLPSLFPLAALLAHAILAAALLPAL